MDLCPIYKDNIIKQNGPDTEMTKFRQTEMFRKLRSDVSAKLGITSPQFQPLDDKTVLNIYEMCRFEKAWFPLKSSGWCAVRYILFAGCCKIQKYNSEKIHSEGINAIAIQNSGIPRRYRIVHENQLRS